jgi:hypothetical protein
MSLNELFKAINDKRLKLDIPLITEERFLEEISLMQVCGKIKIENGIIGI